MTERPPESPRITIVLLAGGSATRLPGKLVLPIGGEPMLVRVYNRLRVATMPIVISARAALAPELAASIDAPVVIDAFVDAGPLGGLVSAAAQVKTPLLAAVAGDLPNLDAPFIADLKREYDDRCAAGERPDAVVPMWRGGELEPLAALYDTQAILQSGRHALEAGRRKVTAALDGLRVAYITVRPEDEARLANVNTPADYRSASP